MGVLEEQEVCLGLRPKSNPTRPNEVGYPVETKKN